MAPRALPHCLLVLFIGLLLPRGALAARISVVATTSDLAALSRSVAGPDADVQALVQPSQDPHFLDARPSLALTLHRADLLVVQGLELEAGWLPVLLTGARNPRVLPGAEGHLDASTVAVLRDVPAGRPDRSRGDVHAGGNPHYLFDPANAARVARAVGARLGALDPPRASAYAQRADAVARELAELGARERERFAALDPARRKLVVYHRSFSYLLSWLQIAEVGAVEPIPGVAPDPAHVAALLARARTEGARAVLQEVYYPTATSKLIAERCGALLVVLPGGADVAAGEGFAQRLKRAVDLLHGALSR